MIHFKNIQYGFEYGGAKVQRLWSYEKTGAICIGIETKKHPHSVQIYVTKTGKVRVLSNDGEWKPRKRKTKKPQAHQ